MDSQLVKGLSILYDMELNNYLMTRATEKLHYEISRLGMSRSLQKPSRHTYTGDGILDYTVAGLSFGGIIGGIIGFIYGMVISDGWLIGLLEGIVQLFVFGFVCGIIGAVIGAIVGIVCRVKGERALDDRYAHDCEEYRKKCEADEVRVARELKQRKILKCEWQELSAKLSDSCDALRSYYDAMGIDKRYRNIVPMSYMCEFIRLGISDHLEGTDGLYYLIMQELRWDQLQYTLEEISQKFDVIIDKQHRLYSALKDINAKCDSMIAHANISAELSVKNDQQLEQAVRNTSIAAYNSERAAKELEFHNFMHAFG